MTDRHAAMMDADTRAAVLRQLRALIHSTQAYFGQHRDVQARALRGHLYEQVDALPHTPAAQHLRTAAMLMDQQAGRFHAALLEALREGIEEEFDAVLPGARASLRPDAAEPESESPISMALLDVDEIERHLLVDRVAQRFNQRYEAQLRVLTQSLAVLLRANGLTVGDNPFRPATVLRAYAVAWQRCGFDPEAAEDFMSALVPEPLGDWGALYEGLTQILVRAGYSAQQVHRIRRTPAATASGHAPLAEAESAASASVPLEPREGPAGRGAGMAARARQFLQKMGFLGHAGAGHAGSGAAPAGRGDASPPGGPASAPAPLQADTELIGFLGGLQQRLGAGVASSQFPSWLDSLEGHDPAAGNLLHRMREREEVRNAPEIDRGTIDALAEVFDYVFADRAIALQLRLLIGRLQVPVLKAAMLDRDFFLSPRHPARRLVDALAAAAVGWIPERGEADPLYQRIHDTVHRVLREFERDLALFDHLREEFQAWLRQQAQEVEATHIAPLARAEDDAEALALARAHADEVVHQCIHACAPGALPAFLLPFLALQWREVLAGAWQARMARRASDLAGPDSTGFAATVPAYAADGPGDGPPEGPDAWDAAVQVMDDLVWSTLPKTTADERARLVGLLPGLVPRLHAELDRLGWQGEARDAFLRRLIDTHMQAIRPPRSSGPQAVPGGAGPAAPEGATAPASTAPPAPASAASATAPADPEDTVGRIALQALDKRRAVQQAAAVPAGAGDAYDAAAGALQRGQWFDLRDDEGRLRRYRLGWVSPQRTRLLFTNREGFEAIVHSEREVAALLRSGRLERLDDQPIVGRAIDQLMAGHARDAQAPGVELQ